MNFKYLILGAIASGFTFVGPASADVNVSVNLGGNAAAAVTYVSNEELGGPFSDQISDQVFAASVAFGTESAYASAQSVDYNLLGNLLVGEAYAIGTNDPDFINEDTEFYTINDLTGAETKLMDVVAPD